MLRSSAADRGLVSGRAVDEAISWSRSDRNGADPGQLNRLSLILSAIVRAARFSRFRPLRGRSREIDAGVDSRTPAPIRG